MAQREDLIIWSTQEYADNAENGKVQLIFFSIHSHRGFFGDSRVLYWALFCLVSLCVMHI